MKGAMDYSSTAICFRNWAARSPAPILVWNDPKVHKGRLFQNVDERDEVTGSHSSHWRTATFKVIPILVVIDVIGVCIIVFLIVSLTLSPK